MDRIVASSALRAFMERVFCAEGFGAQDAAKIADVLMLADLFGIESHGAQRMMYYHKNIESGSVNVNAQIEIVRETPVSALIDGHFAMGQLSARLAMETAIAKAKKTGVGLVAVRNSSHFGIAGYYTLMAERGACRFFHDEYRADHGAHVRQGNDAGHESHRILHAGESRAVLV